jgi:NADPH2 dehydrogenase
MSASESKLFAPIKIGAHTLAHRVVLAPLTRYKANPTDNVPILPLVSEYYTQRASCAGTLLITESTIISRPGGGRDNTPGIWTKEQVAAWKEVGSDGMFVVIAGR